ncbi:SUKH-4 family immunity protein [Streptomyces scopuliridis]|uniref:SUKH-4 family immunity protein n=1 Tax=Streptomyces scopuliridis TaxID=452529 RepID=UPI002DDAC8DD|nr:SUKH-4 family immunity protein [Streptomyces scopuliridis]WSB34455.1 SUKH-4 family immunity protein [Streptomyces scopuliridis]
MRHAIMPEELIRRYGITGVVYFPRYETGADFHEMTASFLSSVGLPHDEQFMTRAEGESILLSEKYAHHDEELPSQCESWLDLGWFQYMVIALDPADGKVYAFPEGDPLDSYVQLHRDVESLVYTLLAFQEFADACRSGADLDQLETQFKTKINSFDPIPFAADDSEWMRIIEEILEESWSA